MLSSPAPSPAVAATLNPSTPAVVAAAAAALSISFFRLYAVCCFGASACATPAATGLYPPAALWTPCPNPAAALPAAEDDDDANDDAGTGAGGAMDVNALLGSGGAILLSSGP